jgi:predicted DNA-binding ribbon-helix-helix protein
MNDAPAPQRVTKRSLQISGHRTSVSLEEIFWSELRAIATAREKSIAALVAEIDSSRGAANLSSALRVFVLENARASALARQ